MEARLQTRLQPHGYPNAHAHTHTRASISALPGESPPHREGQVQAYVHAGSNRDAHQLPQEDVVWSRAAQGAPTGGRPRGSSCGAAAASATEARAVLPGVGVVLVAAACSICSSGAPHRPLQIVPRGEGWGTRMPRSSPPAPAALDEGSSRGSSHSSEPEEEEEGCIASCCTSALDEGARRSRPRPRPPCAPVPMGGRRACVS